MNQSQYYRNEIIDMIEDINREDFLESIYYFTKKLYMKNGSQEVANHE